MMADGLTFFKQNVFEYWLFRRWTKLITVYLWHHIIILIWNNKILSMHEVSDGSHQKWDVEWKSCLEYLK